MQKRGITKEVINDIILYSIILATNENQKLLEKYFQKWDARY